MSPATRQTAQSPTSSPSEMKGLSIPATEPSQRGQTPATSSSSSFLASAALASSTAPPPSLNALDRLLEPTPTPAPTTDTACARASGMISSRSRSPAARSLFRPVTPRRRSVAALPDVASSRLSFLSLRGVPVPDEGKLEESRARAESFSRGTSSPCKWSILRSDAAGRNSMAYVPIRHQATRHGNNCTYHGDETVRVEGVLAREDVKLSRHQRQATFPAPVSLLDRDEAIREALDVALDRFG
jgi:hypothetical protein